MARKRTPRARGDVAGRLEESVIAAKQDPQINTPDSHQIQALVALLTGIDPALAAALLLLGGLAR
jgi:hypothetical protein